MHAVNRKKGIFENVNIDWHLSHDEGYTDFSDDETLDDHRLTLNGSHGGATPNGRHSHHHSHTLHSPDKVRSFTRNQARTFEVNCTASLQLHFILKTFCHIFVVT